MNDMNRAHDGVVSTMTSNALMADGMKAIGMFHAILRGADGSVIWEDEFPNLVTSAGKNFLLDTGLAGSAYTAACYVGLVSSASFSAFAAADTMASHAGWLEAGGANAPTMSSSRQSAVWSAASSGTKALSSGAVFNFTGSGTVQGAFLVVGSGAVNTVGSAAGTLYSAGALSGGAQPVISGNSLTVSYQTTLT